jgi:hypothetical protein
MVNIENIIKKILIEQSEKLTIKKLGFTPLWNKNIKNYTHPAYYDYPSVPNNKIYIKNSDGTFSTKSSDVTSTKKTTTDSPEVLKVKNNEKLNKMFDLHLKSSSDKIDFVNWVKSDNNRVKILKGSFQKGKTPSTTEIKNAWYKYYSDYLEEKNKIWNQQNKFLENLVIDGQTLDEVLSGLNELSVSSTSQKIAGYRGGGIYYILEYLTNVVIKWLTEFDMKISQIEKKQDYDFETYLGMAQRNMRYRNNIGTGDFGKDEGNLFKSLNIDEQKMQIVSWIKKLMKECLSSGGSNIQNQAFEASTGQYSKINSFDEIDSSFDLYVKARKIHEQYKSKMGWTSQSSVIIKYEDLISGKETPKKTTAIDTSFLIGSSLLEYLEILIISRLSQLKEKFKKEKLLQGQKIKKWVEDNSTKSKTTFGTLNPYVTMKSPDIRQETINFFKSSSFYSGSQQDNTNDAVKIIGDIFQIIILYNYHNNDIILQNPIRIVSNTKTVDQSQSCYKTQKMDTKVSPSVTIKRYYYYMKDVCKNFGGMWLSGINAQKFCCCVDLPSSTNRIPNIHPYKKDLEIYQKIEPNAKNINKTTTFITKKTDPNETMSVNLTQSCEIADDTRTASEKINEVVKGCKNDYHCWLDIASVASLIIPGYGLIISMCIDFINGFTYVGEGLTGKISREEASLGAGFSFFGAFMGGGVRQTKGYLKYTTKIRGFANDFAMESYTLSKKANLFTYTDEFDNLFFQMVRKHKLSKSEINTAAQILGDIRKLNPMQIRIYNETLNGIKDRIGIAGFREMGANKGFNKILTDNSGDVILSLDKWMKTQAGKEALQEMGMFIALSDYMPQKMAQIQLTGSQTGKYPWGKEMSIKKMVESTGRDFKSTQTEFGSDGSKEDNNILKKAWLEGWRPNQNMKIVELDDEDFNKQMKEKVNQIEKIKKDAKYQVKFDFNDPKYDIAKLIKPKFIYDKKFGKFATTYRKNKLLYTAIENYKDENRMFKLPDGIFIGDEKNKQGEKNSEIEILKNYPVIKDKL